MIYLASQSPRRRELLDQIRVSYRVISATVDERVHAGEDPHDYVRRVAMGKALAGHVAHPDHPVLGADTVVLFADRILGKPRDATDAVAMLLMLGGYEHRVLTGVALVGVDGSRHYRYSESRVRFRVIKESEAIAYWATGEPCDKAGGYAIQGLGAVFVEHIQGSYSSIMGLPLYETAQLLQLVGEPLPTAV